MFDNEILMHTYEMLLQLRSSNKNKVELRFLGMYDFH